MPPEAFLENEHFYSHGVSASDKMAAAKECTLLLTCQGMHTAAYVRFSQWFIQ